METAEDERKMHDMGAGRLLSVIVTEAKGDKL